MSEPGGNGSTLTYRVSQVEREIEKLEDKHDQEFSDLRTQLGILLRDLAVLSADFHTHLDNVATRRIEIDKRFDSMEVNVTDDVKGLRKVLITSGAAVFLAAITFAITSLAVYGGPG
jgi:hypothetical protein